MRHLLVQSIQLTCVVDSNILTTYHSIRKKRLHCNYDGKEDGIRAVRHRSARHIGAPDHCERELTTPSLGQSGLKVSKVILGAMSYGSDEWQKWVLNEDESLPLLKHAYDCGINTWDTVRIIPSHSSSNRS